MGGDKQAIVPVKAFVVVTLALVLDVAGDQRSPVGYAGNPASRFYLRQVHAEKALADVSFD